jgi:hypothetical protein
MVMTMNLFVYRDHLSRPLPYFHARATLLLFLRLQHEKHLAWAARYGKPHPLSKAELRSFHHTKRDPHAPSSGGIGRHGGAMLAGSAVSQLVAQRTGSDPLDGHRRHKEEHD